MQLYFPNFKTPQGAIAIFEYIRASKIQQESNVIFNSDLNLDDMSNIPGGTGPIENYPNNDTNLFSFLSYVVANWRESTSQVFQDLYVRWKLNNCSKGVFIDIGAGDPVMNNNTLYFEKKLKWSGFLLEPDLRLHKKIEQFRKSPLEKAPLHTENNKKIIFVILND